MKILYISPENTVGTLSTWKNFHLSKGNQCDFITFYKTPNNFDSGICLNLPLISSSKLYRSLRTLHYKINKQSKSEYSPNVDGLPIIKIIIAMAIAAAIIENPILIIVIFI